MLAFLRGSQVPFTNSQAEQDVRMIDKAATEGLGQGPGQAGAQNFVPLRRVLSSAWKLGRNHLETLPAAADVLFANLPA